MLANKMDLNNKHDIFENSMFIGNVRNRVKLLMQSNQLALAYASAKSHNLHDLIPFIEEEIKNRELSFVENFSQQIEERSQKAKSLLPCRPVFIENEDFTSSNWPHTMLLQSNIQDKMECKNEEFHDASATQEDTGKDISDLLTSFKDNKNIEGELEIDIKGEDLDPLDGDLGGEGNWPDDIQIDDDDILGNIEGAELGDPDLVDLDNEINKKEEKEVFVPPTRSNDPLKQSILTS